MYKSKPALNHIVIPMSIFMALLIWLIDLAYGFLSVATSISFYFLFLPLVLICAIAFLAKKRPSFFCIVTSCFIVVFTSFFAAHGIGGGMVYRAEGRGNIIIESLNEYREDNGSYPDDLSSLIPQYLKKIPKPEIGVDINQEFKYSAYNEREEYSLSYMRTFLLSGKYLTRKKRWHYDD